MERVGGGREMGRRTNKGEKRVVDYFKNRFKEHMGIKQKLDRVHLETLGRDDNEVLFESFRDT